MFRAYARHLGSDRALKQNTIHTYYHYISAWCGWCANEGYLRGHYARRASAMAPLPMTTVANPATSRYGHLSSVTNSSDTLTSESRTQLRRTERFRMMSIPSTGSERDIRS